MKRLQVVRVIFCWDCICAFILALLLGYWLPARVNNTLAGDIYSMGVTVLSIVFSLFFAALAIILSGSDEEFVLFLEESGLYTKILFALRVALAILFGGLLYSVLAYGITRFMLASKEQLSIYLAVFCMLFFWALFSAFNAANDCIIYCSYRVTYLKRKEKGDG